MLRLLNIIGMSMIRIYVDDKDIGYCVSMYTIERKPDVDMYEVCMYAAFYCTSK